MQKSNNIVFAMGIAILSLSGCETATAKLDADQEIDTGESTTAFPVSPHREIDAGPSLYSQKVACPVTNGMLHMMLETSGGSSGSGYGNFEVTGRKLKITNIKNTPDDECEAELSDIQMDEMINEVQHVKWPDLLEEYAIETPGTCPGDEIGFTLNATFGKCRANTHLCKSHLDELNGVSSFVNWCQSTFYLIYESTCF